MKKKEQPELDDFYTNINMVAQVISPMLWVFFYLPAMKGKVIKHSKLFTATYIGRLNSGIFGIFKLSACKLNLKSSDCRASKIT